jgi:hypothetical protein
MNEFTNQDIAAMLAVIYKRFEDIENMINEVLQKGDRSYPSVRSCLEKLQREAQKAFI